MKNKAPKHIILLLFIFIYLVPLSLAILLVIYAENLQVSHWMYLLWIPLFIYIAFTICMVILELLE